MERTGNLNSGRQSSRQRSRTETKVSVVVKLKQKSKVWSFDQQELDSHTGRILILLGDVRRDTTVAISVVVTLNLLAPEF
jgi:hypothetical protein